MRFERKFEGILGLRRFEKEEKNEREERIRILHQIELELGHIKMITKKRGEEERRA